MAQMRKDRGLFTEKPLLAGYFPSEVKTKDVLRGIYAVTPEVGNFTQNSVGLTPEAITVDLWSAGTNRIIGRLTDVSEVTNAEGSIASELRGRAERDMIHFLVRDAAKSAGIFANAMQATLRYFEQRLPAIMESDVTAKTSQVQPERPSRGSRALTEVQLEAMKLRAAMLAEARAADKKSRS
jgi:hypothetical protein